jgi:nicotinate-nucleotide adenylyltransferase
MNIGLYFGSFNPIHHGHLIIANHILNYEGMDQVWFIVSPHNPLKETASLLNEYHRLHLVQLAIEGSSSLRASDFEFKLPRPSYTIDTLTYLKEEYPKHNFSIIMGSDSFQNIHKWKNASLLLRDHPILIYLRPGHHELNVAEFGSIRVVKAPQFDISSSFVRETIRKGKSIRYLVPDIVMEEIEKNGYYKHK